MSARQIPTGRGQRLARLPTPRACPRGDAAIGDLQADIQPEAAGFYRLVMRTLLDANVPFLVGGAFALAYFTGIRRTTKDLDLFVRREDLKACLDALRDAGMHTEITFSHWLSKARRGDHFVDLIYSSGNGCADVDARWFTNAVQATVLGRRVLLSPPEEIIWSKAYVMERDRYDGADVAHLLLACGPGLDWQRMLDNFGEHWRVLMSHLVMFGFIYPGARDRIPQHVMQDLAQRLVDEGQRPDPQADLCRGTLLSRWQYQVDLDEWGYQDALLSPRGSLSPDQIALWTAEIGGERPGMETGVEATTDRLRQIAHPDDAPGVETQEAQGMQGPQRTHGSQGAPETTEDEPEER